MRCWTGRRRANDEGERLVDAVPPDTGSRILLVDMAAQNLTRVDSTRMSVRGKVGDVFVIIFAYKMLAWDSLQEVRLGNA